VVAAAPLPRAIGIALISVKGGVGKTTTAVNLAYLAAASGERVLLWDLDPQGATTFVLRAAPDDEIIQHASSPDVWATDYDRLDVVRSAAHSGEVQRIDRVSFTRGFDAVSQWYDIVFFDCAAGLDGGVPDAVSVVDAVLVPLLPTPLGVRTLAQLERYLKRLPDPPTVLPFFSMVDRRRALHRDIVEALQIERTDTLSAQIVNAAIVERMAARFEPVVHTAPDSGVSASYRALWQEVRDRLEM
jgi:cellulose biosynthesis protein BcsQ